MPNPNPAAATAAAAKKRSKGKGRKVSKAEKARLLAVAAVDEGRARKKAAENVAAEDGKGEAEVEEKDWSQQRRANQARTDGSVKKVNPSPCDLEARAEAACERRQRTAQLRARRSRCAA